MHESLPAFLSFLSEPRLLVAAAILLLGVLFGALAESSQFCLLGGIRDTVDGAGWSRLSAFGAAALVAVAVTQGLVGLGYLDLSPALYLTAIAALPAVAIGGFMFGVGAAMTRGCAGRLTVLTATGNLRALVVIIVVAIAGYAAMRGLLAPLRMEVESLGRPAAAYPDIVRAVGLSETFRIVLAFAAALGAFALARVAGLYRGLAGVAIGALIAGAWSASSILGDDGFDKIAPWAPSFINPLGSSLIYLLTYTGARIDAGVTFIAGSSSGPSCRPFWEGGRDSCLLKTLARPCAISPAAFSWAWAGDGDRLFDGAGAVRPVDACAGLLCRHCRDRGRHVGRRRLRGARRRGAGRRAGAGLKSKRRICRIEGTRPVRYQPADEVGRAKRHQRQSQQKTGREHFAPGQNGHCAKGPEQRRQSQHDAPPSSRRRACDKARLGVERGRALDDRFHKRPVARAAVLALQHPDMVGRGNHRAHAVACANAAVHAHAAARWFARQADAGDLIKGDESALA